MYPILFRFGGLTIYAYGFFLAAGFVVGGLFAVSRARKAGVPLEKVADLFFCSVLSAIVGSRISFVIINLDLFRHDFFKIFRIWEGGLIFYGGLILSAGVSVGCLKWKRMPVWKTADLFSPPIALGLFLGRIGCFLAGCCYGKETTLPWGVAFANPDSLAPLHVRLHPTQLYDAVNGLVLFAFLIWLERRKSFDGQTFWVFLLLYSLGRFMVERVRGDPRGFLFQDYLSTSQGVGVCLAIASLFMLSYLYKRCRRT